MKQLNKDISKVTDNYYKDCTMIPIFINNNNNNHIRCKNLFITIGEILLPLFNTKFLPNSEVNELTTLFIDNIIYMSTIDNNIAHKYFNYALSIFNYYLIICTEKELYEASTNILKWIKNIEKYKPISKWINS